MKRVHGKLALIVTACFGCLLVFLLLRTRTSDLPDLGRLEWRELREIDHYFSYVIRNYLEYARSNDPAEPFAWRRVLEQQGYSDITKEIDERGWHVVVTEGASATGEVFRLVGRYRYALVAYADGWEGKSVHMPTFEHPWGEVTRMRRWFADDALPLVRARWLAAKRRLDARAVPPSRDTHDLHYEGVPLGRALLEIERRAQVRFCYEDYSREGRNLSYTELFNTPVRIAANRLSLSQALDALAEATGAFVWRQDEDIVNIIASPCMELDAYPLNEKLGTVTFNGGRREMLLRLCSISTRLHIGSGVVDGYEPPASGQTVRIVMSSTTVRQFLNAFCKQSGGVWLSYFDEEYGRVHVDIVARNTQNGGGS